MSSSPAMRTKIFISYSHKDAIWLQRVRVHLKRLERHFAIEAWDDTHITPGSIWKEEIKRAIASCRVAVLLISEDFIASEFIDTAEIPPLLIAAREDGAVILPLVLKPSSISEDPNLSQFQAVNDVARPMINLSEGEQEEVLVKLGKTIKSIFVNAAALDSEVVHAPGPVRSTADPQLDLPPEQIAEATREPQFLAQFALDRNGDFKKSGKRNDHYEIRLFIKDAPADTKKVIYELHHTYPERIREAPKGRREFEEYITSYGDYIVNITIFGDGKTKMSDWLTRALENFYGDDAPDEIAYAIKMLEDH
jgi:hypothetical protein